MAISTNSPLITAMPPFMLGGDDKWTILRIATLALSSAAHYRRKARDQDVIIAATSNDHASTSKNSNMGSSSEADRASHKLLRTHLKKLETDLVDIDRGFSSMGSVTEQVSILFENLEHHAKMLQSICRDKLLPADASSPIRSDKVDTSIQDIADVVSKLKLHLPGTEHVRVESATDLINHLIKLPAYEKFADMKALQNFEDKYRSLDQKLKHCLFCFSVFPKDYVVEKTSMMYWWIGEGLIKDAELDCDKAVEVANEIVKNFLELEFVEPRIEKGKLVGLSMNPVIRFAVAYLAERAGFCDFDFTWNPTADFHLCRKAFLVKIEKEIKEEYSRVQMMKDKHLNPGELQTMLNVNDHVLSFEAQWFSRVRDIKVLCLGTCSANVSESPHSSPLKVENANFLKELKYMKQLKFLSLRGLEGFSLLPPDAMGNLKDLRILNLNNCSNLTRLPSNIESLQKLIHLDFSGCDSINDMPKGIRQLKELQVLRGFVISDTKDTRICTLDDLAGLKKLRKLSIVTDTEAFPTTQELNALSHMESLRKLKLRWGRNDRPIMRRDLFQRATIPGLPQDLEKLELEDFPDTRAPGWLVPSKLNCLRKLYIRGGKLHDLHQAQGENDKWKVMILRLRSLSKFHMDWTTVEDEFPDLIYVEKVDCPMLTSFPYEQNGAWLNNEMLSPDLLKQLGFSWSFLRAGTC